MSSFYSASVGDGGVFALFDSTISVACIHSAIELFSRNKSKFKSCYFTKLGRLRKSFIHACHHFSVTIFCGCSYVASKLCRKTTTPFLILPAQLWSVSCLVQHYQVSCSDKAVRNKHFMLLLQFFWQICILYFYLTRVFPFEWEVHLVFWPWKWCGIPGNHTLNVWMLHIISVIMVDCCGERVSWLQQWEHFITSAICVWWPTCPLYSNRLYYRSFSMFT